MKKVFDFFINIFVFILIVIFFIVMNIVVFLAYIFWHCKFPAKEEILSGNEYFYTEKTDAGSDSIKVEKKFYRTAIHYFFDKSYKTETYYE